MDQKQLSLILLPAGVRRTSRQAWVKTVAGCLAAIVLAAGCGTAKDRISTAGQSPTPLTGSQTPGVDIVDSDPVEMVGREPVLVSTSGSVVLAGGVDPGTGLPVSRVSVLDRASGSWRPLAALPEAVLVLDGSALADVPYLLAARCHDLPDRQPDVDLGDLCSDLSLFRLVDGGEGWEKLTPPPDVFTSDGVSGFGAIGDHELAMLSSSAPYQEGLVTFDATNDSWSSADLPVGAADFSLDPCFTDGVLLLRTFGEKFGVSTPAVNEQFAFRVWGRTDDKWLGPAMVDLGSVRPVEGATGSEICANGSFSATNVSAGGRGVFIDIDGGEVRANEQAIPNPGDGPKWGPVRAAVSETHVIRSNSEATVRDLNTHEVLQPGQVLLYSAETASHLDLLISDSESSSTMHVMTTRKN